MLVGLFFVETRQMLAVGGIFDVFGRYSLLLLLFLT